MESGKADNSLNLAISLPEAERVSSAALSTGYDAATNRWELIEIGRASCRERV